MAIRCSRCRAPVERADVELRHEVGERVFVGAVTGAPCASCGEGNVSDVAGRRFALHVANELRNDGSGAALRFMRRALDVRASELAPLLGVAVETMSRWENGRRAVPRAAYTVLSAMIRDAMSGTSTTLDNLRALAAPKPQPRRVRVASDDRRARRRD